MLLTMGTCTQNGKTTGNQALGEALAVVHSWHMGRGAVEGLGQWRPQVSTAGSHTRRTPFSVPLFLLSN